MASPQPDKFTKLSNELLEQFSLRKIPSDAQSILNVIIRKTYGYGKKIDSISISQFQKLTGLDRRNAVRAIRYLQSMNMISVVKGDNREIIKYSIQKDWEKWFLLSRMTILSIRAKTIVSSDNKPIVSSDTHKRKKEIQKKEPPLKFEEIEKFIETSLSRIATVSMIQTVMKKIPEEMWWKVDRFLKIRYPQGGNGFEKALSEIKKTSRI